tara:strand:+ start:1032 stop:1874 length:843 start_codon:yes stop_codon:yes gene_type:complete
MNRLSLHPLTGSCGAEISGLNLSNVSDAEFCIVHAALLDHGVIFIRDQDISLDQQVAFARRFGELEVHPIVDGMEQAREITKVWKPKGQSASFGTGWHSDNTFQEHPSMGSMLYGKTIPPFGGDTIFANQHVAYERLPDAMKEKLDGLFAIHSASEAYTVEGTKEKFDKKTAITYTWDASIMNQVRHPIVRTHPENGKKALFVNDMFTLRVDEMEPTQSRELLQTLYQHCTKPEFCCRFRWTENAVALWDNRLVQHYAVDDYQDYERLMYRVTIEGDRPK